MRTVMSVAATTSAPSAGWYPDPTEPAEHLRWWDGSTWTQFTTDVPEPEPEPHHPFADIVVDIAPGDDVEAEDAFDDESEPIEFSWADPGELFEVTVPEPERDGPFVFRARALEPRPVDTVEIEIPTLPVYESPLATISSPVSVRVEVPVHIETNPLPAPTAVEPEPEAEAEVEPEAAVEVAEPAEAEAAPPSRRRVALAGTGVVVVVAAAAAGVTNLLVADDAGKPAAAAAALPSLPAEDAACMKRWNTATGDAAAQLRVTLGQFEGAYAQVGRVAPLPGTVMAPDSCALTVYDPSSDTHATFVAGVKDQPGYLDVTAYPRAEIYGWPKNAREANVTIRQDGSVRAL